MIAFRIHPQQRGKKRRTTLAHSTPICERPELHYNMSEEDIVVVAPPNDAVNPKKNNNNNNNSSKNHAGNQNKRSRHQRRNKNGNENFPGGNPAKIGGKNNSKQQKRPMSGKKLSHSLSWALRHAALNIGLTIREDGYVPIQEILDSTHPKLKGATLENIREVVETSDKQRFRLEERPKHLYYPNDINGETVLCIRANQGHSISVINPEQLLTKLSPTDIQSLPCIVHGTSSEAWESIKATGLKIMKRTHIHFASGLPSDDGVISGMRRNSGIYIYIDASKCASDDRIEFFKSDNGVILTDGIGDSGLLPTEYFSRVTDSSGTILLDNRNDGVK